MLRVETSPKFLRPLKTALMNPAPSLSHLMLEWHRGIGPGSSVAILLATGVLMLLTRAYIRRRNSVIRSLQGPPSSSFIFGWSL